MGSPFASRTGFVPPTGPLLPVSLSDPSTSSDLSWLRFRIFSMAAVYHQRLEPSPTWDALRTYLPVGPGANTS